MNMLCPRKDLLLTLCGCLLLLELNGQDVRTLDGSQNNPIYADWGAARTAFKTDVGYDYSDGISEPAGVNRSNPRVISNTIFAQSGKINDQLSLSDYVWVFGQFIDHDMVLSENDHTEPLLIPVPSGDPYMDPFGTGQMVIPMMRSEYDPATGTDISNPRVHINSTTSFIDGSVVYGSDNARGIWLRTFENGKLKVSDGNLMPFNTSSGEFNSPTDPSAPVMADDVGEATKLFVAGDVRANENPLLLAVHTVFVREHNRLCDLYLELYPGWDDERLYQKARRLVSGLIQSITYNEWLPAMGVEIPAYRGYMSGVDPRITNEFAAAAFRFGYTLLSSEIVRMAEDGSEIAIGNISLSDAFFAPNELLIAGGLEPYFKGMGTQIEQDLDCKIIDDVRNFLFEPPGSGGLDLAAINIMRGRERGLPSFNGIRLGLGLEPYTEFGAICSNSELEFGLQELYNSVDDVDAWVGMLAEDHMPATLFGPTIMTIMEDQFTRLRDGDRFFYLHDPGLTREEIDEISETTFADIIRRNTKIALMQDDVFFAKDHDDLPFARAQVAKSHLDMVVFPNPIEQEANIKMYSTENGMAFLEVVDVSGKLRYSQEMPVQEGINIYSFQMADLLIPGVYFLQIHLSGELNSIKLVRR